MNAEVKEKWIAALRSGKYKQGKSALRRSTKNGDRYCCLGVLCDISGIAEWQPGVFGGDKMYDGRTAYLPASVRKWAGIDHEEAELTGSQFLSLVDANDAGKKFAAIADLIEKHL